MPTVEIAIGGKAIMDLRPDASGALLGELPPGKYDLRYGGGGGRGARGATQTIAVLANQESPVTLEVTRTGPTARAMHGAPKRERERAPVPCKATFEGIGAPNPDFGPGHVSGPAKNQVTTLRWRDRRRARAREVSRHALARSRVRALAIRGRRRAAARPSKRATSASVVCFAASSTRKITPRATSTSTRCSASTRRRTRAIA